MRRDDQINQALQMYVLLLRNKQLFTRGIARTHTKRKAKYNMNLHVHVCAM
jgi:hypothetical protein